MSFLSSVADGVTPRISNGSSELRFTHSCVVVVVVVVILQVVGLTMDRSGKDVMEDGTNANVGRMVVILHSPKVEITNKRRDALILVLGMRVGGVIVVIVVVVLVVPNLLWLLLSFRWVLSCATQRSACSGG